MKKLVATFAILFVVGCGEYYKGDTGDKGDQGEPGPPGPEGDDTDPCRTEQYSDRVVIQCGDYDPVVVYNGDKGDKGDPGDPGPQGPAGENGDPGSDGQGCAVATVVPSIEVPNGGAAVTCGANTVVILNGRDGENGEVAPLSAFSVAEIIDPCGDSGEHDEVFQRLNNGQLIALFVENGNAKTARLSYLYDGAQYQTTDEQKCKFSLATVGGVRTMTTTSPVTSTKSWQVN